MLLKLVLMDCIIAMHTGNGVANHPALHPVSYLYAAALVCQEISPTSKPHLQQDRTASTLQNCYTKPKHRLQMLHGSAIKPLVPLDVSPKHRER